MTISQRKKLIKMYIVFAKHFFLPFNWNFYILKCVTS